MGDGTLEIIIVDEKPLLVAGMRRYGHYKEIAKMVPALFAYVRSQGAVIAGLPLNIMHEKSMEEAGRADEAGNADIEVCVPIAEKIPENDEIKCYELPGKKMAKTIRNGSHEACGQAYESLSAWFEQNGHTLAGPVREVSLNDPRAIPPEEVLIAIYAPFS